ncbi:type II secretion system protein [Paratissierella segnis]|uniref:type II secretion system protein n=1 Tax=Paratissierella segnis TaxID=2763679 RepID=UPI00223A8E74|nr:type II secretion system protein [Paratissierella segnis]
MMINTNSHKGYTIIELLAILAIFAIILSIAAPKITILNRIKEQQELREFRKDILYARNRAIVDNKRYTVYLNYNDNSYMIKCNITVNKWETVKKYKFEYGIELIKNSEHNKISFTGSGTASVADSFYIKDSKDRTYVLTVAVNTGKVTIRSID